MRRGNCEVPGEFMISDGMCLFLLADLSVM